MDRLAPGGSGQHISEHPKVPVIPTRSVADPDLYGSALCTLAEPDADPNYFGQTRFGSELF